MQNTALAIPILMSLNERIHNVKPNYKKKSISRKLVELVSFDYKVCYKI